MIRVSRVAAWLRDAFHVEHLWILPIPYLIVVSAFLLIAAVEPR